MAGRSPVSIDPLAGAARAGECDGFSFILVSGNIKQVDAKVNALGHGPMGETAYAQVIRCRTAAEMNSLISTTPNTATSISETSCHWNWLMEE